MSLDRLAEVHNMEDEEVDSENKITKIPENNSISISRISYQYEVQIAFCT